MRLKSFEIRKFRNIIDSSEIPVEDDVTCLVGKNESGKTAVLHALNRLNPARPAAFSVQQQYPAWLEKLDRLRGDNLEEFPPIHATFELDDEEVAALKERFGPKTFTSDKKVSVNRSYGGRPIYTFNTDEKAAVAYAMKGLKLSGGALEAKKAETFEQIEQLVAKLRDGGEQGDVEQADTIENAVTAMCEGAPLRQAFVTFLSARLPKFFYFGEYSQLPGSIPVTLLEAEPEELSEAETTAVALLRLAAADDDYLVDPEYDVRQRELENISNALTGQVLSYWSQNPELRVMIGFTQRQMQDEHGHPIAVVDEFRLRMNDDRHMLSLPFDERSTGFKWFFSFLAAFSEFESAEGPVIILLDEPALGLHARAQKDFLRFIQERLAARHQVIYSTHSPFMVEPGHLERVRLVEDLGRDEGAKVSTEVLATDPDTLFPLQGAIGYDMAQHLFIGQHNLVVEGTSDFTYLVVMSDFLKEQGKQHLDDQWTVVPTGGAEYIPTFVALLGQQLDLTVLIDAQRGGHQRLSTLANRGYLSHKRIVTVGQVLGRAEADIEDLFDADYYLGLYNDALGGSVTKADLQGNGRIVRQIARHLSAERYDHGRPADHLLRNRDTILPTLSKVTLDRFEKLFEMLNATLPS